MGDLHLRGTFVTITFLSKKKQIKKIHSLVKYGNAKQRVNEI